jgi:hypothetical protein
VVHIGRRAADAASSGAGPFVIMALVLLLIAPAIAARMSRARR